ncbi:MAG: FecR domain-containing protein [Candidatus Omnitrophica bacterium]|nr:FecR domain-containing protein [Candidatus Omnitrophota bacterium]
MNRPKIFTCAVFILFLCAYGFAEEVGQITCVTGRVDVLRPDSQMAEPLREGQSIWVGDIIRTKSNSKAEITFKDKSILRMAQNSKVRIKDYKLAENNGRETATIDLKRGKLRTIIAKMKSGADFNINTPNAQGKITGSDVFAFYQAGNSGMLVAEGKLLVSNAAHPENILAVPSGNSVLVPQDEFPKGPRQYLEVEKRFHEMDTNPPPSISRRKSVTVIEGSVTRLFGQVEITPKAAKKTHQAKIGEMVGEGYAIKTGQDGMVEIKFDNANALNLKPDTELIITKLVIDPQTQEYENSFEVTMGKVRARIENLKEGSSFKIKTPTAVSGARGTIMYLEVLQNLTRAFFEGGTGFLTSLLSGDTTDINAGQNASADAEGRVSSAFFTSEEQRMHFGEGWDPGSGVEGYSSPEGSAGEYFYDSETGLEGGGDTTGLGDTVGGAGDEFLNGPVITEVNPFQTEVIEEVWAFIGELFGYFGYYDYYSNEAYLEYGDITGLLEILGPLWSEEQALALAGTFLPPQAPYQDYDKLWAGDIGGAGSDGSRFLGVAGGINNSLEAILYAFYIRPVAAGGYRAGYIKSTDLTGVFDFNLKIFQAVGNTSSYLDLPTTVTPSQLHIGSPAIEEDYDIFGTVAGSTFSGKISGDSANIVGQEWGLWKTASGGRHANIPLDGWQAYMGGLSVDEDTFQINSYWIGTMQGSAWQNGEFAGTSSGETLSFSTFGRFGGDFLGTYDSRDWQALSAGVYTNEALLASSGQLHATIAYYGSSSGEQATLNAVAQGAGLGFFSFNGLIGLTDSLWNDAKAHFISIGNLPFLTEEKFIWHSRQGALFSYTHDEVNPQFTTFADASGALGAFTGVSAGRGSNDVLEGIAYLLYIDPQQNAGVVSAYLNGFYSAGMQGIQMYELEGDFLKQQPKVSNLGIAPQDLVNSIVWANLYGSSDRGGFNSGGGIYQETLQGIMLNISQQDWGIWNMDFTGTYSGSTSNNWQVFDLTGMTDTVDQLYLGGVFLGGLTGTQWSGNKLNADLNAVWIELGKDGSLCGKSISGEVLGNYVDVKEGSTWQAAGCGEWVEVDSLLDLTGPVDDVVAMGDAGLPITEVYSSLLVGAGSFNGPGAGAISANMNMDFYAMGASADGIWAAIINGTYSTPISDAWTLDVSGAFDDGGALTATLTGIQWSGGNWQADVSGSTTTGIELSGIAGGVYTPAAEGQGSFSGSATGTWEQGE